MKITGNFSIIKNKGFRIKTFFIFFLMMLMFFSCKKSMETKEDPYRKIQSELLQGWNTFNTRNLLSWVYMPDGLELAIDFKYQGKNFSGYLPEVLSFNKPGSDAFLKPIGHAYDGSYTESELTWHGIHANIQTASKDDQFYCRVSLLDSVINKKAMIVLRPQILWNRKGYLAHTGENKVTFYGDNIIELYACSPTTEEYNVTAASPYFVLTLDSTASFCTGKKADAKEIAAVIREQKEAWHAHARNYGKDLGDAYRAISTCMAWNTIYDPVNNRVVSTVSRPWNVERGGYTFFGWDNFFLAYLASIDNKNLAYANVIEHLNDMTEEGFIPNNSQANGRKTWDRSQPSVGSIMVKEIYQKYQDKWFLDSTYQRLLTWNRWWMKRRYYKGMLCWGSHESKNPYNDQVYHSLRAAMLETGLDDSPMYEELVFNSDSNVMELHDAGLNGLYVADCEALAYIAGILGKDKDVEELTRRASYFRERLKTLWSEEDGIFLNKRTDKEQFVKKLSPTLFYPLMAKAATREQAERMIQEHFYNPEEFWGEWVLPSIARNDPAFEKQKYWKGSVWAPLNFLTYLSLREYDLPDARKDLAEKSLTLFLKEWNRQGFVSENYSSENGTSDDPKLKSDRFYTWGGLLGIIAFMERE